MFQPQLKLLRTTDIDLQLGRILATWDAAPEQHLEFINWALDVATEAEQFAQSNRGIAVEAVRTERDLTHRRIAERLLQTSTIDLQLVSKRMFFEWLFRELQPARLAA